MSKCNNLPTIVRQQAAPVIARSTGADPAGWRLWWREQAQIDGADWTSLHRQLVGAWRALRLLADEVSSS